MSDSLTAYCMKCREKRPIANPEATFNQRGGPVTRGTCPECNTGLYRMGRTEAHTGLVKPEPPPKTRSGNLVIVESPTKARTIGRFLGKGHKVMASVGHVRDLLRSQLSVDVEHDFEPRYRVPNEKRAVVKELSAAVDDAATVYLATDPDREGEAIAWHLMEATGLDAQRAQRVVFHEITASAVSAAFAEPAALNMDLVNAQQARRVLDRLVGYKISPLLWARVRNRLTAGRVQSVAVRLVVEREREIEAFQPVEYWSLQVELSKRQDVGANGRAADPSGGAGFMAKLHRVAGQPVDLPDRAAVEPILDALENGVFQVAQVRSGERRRSPRPPFTTSTLQQTASQRLGFRAQRTMRVAQSLYEGVDLEADETVGLITYMRTDSVSVAAVARQQARAWIGDTYGSPYLPKTPPHYETKTKAAQEAHEAIRPTDVQRTPNQIKPHLSRDQFRLYQLIWQRFVASEMTPARFKTRSVDIESGPAGGGKRPYLFRAAGSTLEFPGYLVVYEEEATEQPAGPPPLSRVRTWTWCACCPSSISPSPRLDTLRRRWCTPSRSTASAARAPTPLSYRPSNSGIMSSVVIKRATPSDQPTPASWSLTCWWSISGTSSRWILPPAWRNNWTRSRPGSKIGCRWCVNSMRRSRRSSPRRNRTCPS